MRNKGLSINDGINQNMRDAIKSDGTVPMGSAKNKPDDHPWQGGFKGKGERFKAYRNGKTNKTKKLSKGSQFYYTRDRNPDGSQKVKLNG